MTTTVDAARELMPGLPAIVEIFTALVGQTVRISESEPVLLAPRTAASVAEFIDDDETLPIVVVSDLALACRASAALMMAAPDGVAAQIDGGVIDEEVSSNYRKAVDVMSSVFNQSGGLNYKLVKQHVTPTPLPGRVVLALLRPAARLDLAVEIPDYGAGRISFVVARPLMPA